MYVEDLVGPDTVNTMPPATLDALMDRGTVVPDTVESDLPGARAESGALRRRGISLADVTHRCRSRALPSFAASYDAMLAAISAKHEQLAGAVAAKGSPHDDDAATTLPRPGADGSVERNPLRAGIETQTA